MGGHRSAATRWCRMAAILIRHRRRCHGNPEEMRIRHPPERRPRRTPGGHRRVRPSQVAPIRPLPGYLRGPIPRTPGRSSFFVRMFAAPGERAGIRRPTLAPARRHALTEPHGSGQQRSIGLRLRFAITLAFRAQTIPSHPLLFARPRLSPYPNGGLGLVHPEGHSPPVRSLACEMGLADAHLHFGPARVGRIDEWHVDFRIAFWRIDIGERASLA